jgi:hypothetical protein
MTQETLGMNTEQRISGSDRRTFLKGAGDLAASVVAAESALAQQAHNGHPPSLHSSLDRTLCPKRLLRHQLACRNSWLLIQPTECHARLGWKVLRLRLASAKNRRRPLPGRCLALIQKYLTHVGLQLRIRQAYVTARSRQRVNAFRHFLSITALAP